jgi:hypothetical protein
MAVDRLEPAKYAASNRTIPASDEVLRCSHFTSKTTAWGSTGFSFTTLGDR